jgi:Cu(I)/Ag(I) efflux system protein CusF
MKPLPAIIISVLAAATIGACGPSSDTKSPDGKTMSKDSGMKGMDMSKGDMKGMDMKGVASDKKADGQVHKATGKVTKVDRAAATVTIDHGPVASMNWPSMSMAFKVKDPAMLEKIKQGAQVEFSFAQSGKDHVITDIK